MKRLNVVTHRVLAFAGVVVASGCTENLPNGPNTFVGHLAIVAAHDTVVVGDAHNLSAKATDDGGNVSAFLPI